MPQLHFYVPQELADRIRREAAKERMSVSRYVAELVRHELTPEWPEGYFETVVGGWQGEALQRPPQGEFESREEFEPAGQ